MRHVGVRFKLKYRGTWHISQGAKRENFGIPGVQFTFRALCGEGVTTDLGTIRADMDDPPVPFCKKCQRAAESIAQAIGWQPLDKRPVVGGGKQP